MMSDYLENRIVRVLVNWSRLIYYKIRRPSILFEAVHWLEGCSMADSGLIPTVHLKCSVHTCENSVWSLTDMYLPKFSAEITRI
jgi:hypothetical protein